MKIISFAVFEFRRIIKIHLKMTSRTRKTTIKAPTTMPGNKRVENSWIMLVKESLLENKNISIITLPHPAHGKSAKYCLDHESKKIFEVATFNEPYRSWFIGETVKSDGSIQITTPINPTFLVLPRLIDQCSSRAIPLEDLLSEKGFDKILDFINDLNNVADIKGPPVMKAYKYNEDKTLLWLEDRVQRVAKVLRAKNIHVTSGAVSATFVTSDVSNETIDEDFYLKYAFGVVSEYLQQALATKLEKKFNFKPYLVESVGKKRNLSIQDNIQDKNKRMKTDHSLDMSGSFTGSIKPEIKKLKPPTAKEQKRVKAASGAKTISSFFTKK